MKRIFVYCCWKIIFKHDCNINYLRGALLQEKIQILNIPSSENRNIFERVKRVTNEITIGIISERNLSEKRRPTQSASLVIPHAPRSIFQRAHLRRHPACAGITRRGRELFVAGQRKLSGRERMWRTNGPYTEKQHYPIDCQAENCASG